MGVRGTLKCLLRVNMRQSPGVPPTSGAGGRAEAIGWKADIGQRMSALGGGADVLAAWPESPLLAKRRHSVFRFVLL